ncbi:MAG: Fe-S cluster assembly protein SufD [Acetobacter sp.]|nr:Fe-S cluster assembly protein SufD [Acetobacter sp.]
MTDSPLLKNVKLFLDDKPAVYALRQKARQTLKQTGFPSSKNEAWKYTDLTPILNNDFKISTDEHTCGHNCCTHSKPNSSFIEIKFCRGKLHIEEYNTPEGLTITPLPLALFEGEYKQCIFNSFNLEEQPFACLNGVYLEQGLCITVEKEIVTPIHIIYNQNNCENLQLNIHNIIVAEKNSSLEIIEEFTSNTNERSLTNIVNEFYLKTNSHINHYKIQKENNTAYHIALNAAKIQSNATYKQYYLAAGAKICRNESIINLEHSDARTEVYSAYMAKKDCLTDITTNINHKQPNTFSNQYAKAVLEDNSSAVFQGKIHISPNAVKVVGNQLHKALYLNDNATLNCKPELEIYADDVKCSHGASCGEIDKEQLFYLTSRGIDKQTAIQLLTSAHLEEIIALIPNEKIKDLFYF